MMGVTLEVKRLSVPNVLSLSRVFFIPAILILLSMGGRYDLLASLLFLLAAFTDLADGLVARKFNSITPLGKLLDPLADKLLVCLSLIMLVHLRRAPAWIVVLIVARELIVTGIRAEGRERGKIIGARTSGKLKAVIQYLAIFCLCIWKGIQGIPFDMLGRILLWAALFLTLYSGLSMILDSLKER
ncbi:MAG: CDP-diacylglycerol--glycerol-3-phosphate 3-phosphatidyltransferase [Desulfatiglandales bacterium]